MKHRAHPIKIKLLTCEKTIIINILRSHCLARTLVFSLYEGIYNDYNFWIVLIPIYIFKFYVLGDARFLSMFSCAVLKAMVME